ncbi:DNA alkylation repair protein [Thalassomonas viridans]|uniref:DNA alkylation repair protein n=1 Tax=Thalassomonas viridans TaxID=137584 RepID=A0AAE9Z1G9_9GAMM|nr:DNA alkylation repair protein [Thalassomonas viridans]WDE04299.1 DNA alkylation repair protein [Thalassomonas viridans]
MSYQSISEHLTALANPEIAAHSQGFFKTAKGEYGYGDKFLGIRVPVLRQQVKHFKKTSLATAEQVLSSPYHEIRLFALLLLVYRFQRADEAEREAIYHLYLKNTQHINNWDLVDSSAHVIVGGYLLDRDKAPLTQLAQSNILWERRIAIIATLHFIKHGQYTPTLTIAELLLTDSHDLIHKAVGWMLRELGKRKLALEQEFLQQHYKNMPRTMLRYSIEKFSKAERDRYLRGLV